VSASGELRALAPGDCGLTALVGAISANLNTHIRARVGNIIRLDIRGKVLEAVGAGTCDLLSIVDGIRASVKVNVRGRGDDGSSDQITRLEIRGKVALDLGERRSCRPSRCSTPASRSM